VAGEGPLYGRVLCHCFWGLVALAILFMRPCTGKLLRRMPGKSPNLAALATLVLCLVVVILPLALIGISLIQEATHIYDRLRSGQLNFGAVLEQVIAALPCLACRHAGPIGTDQCGCGAAEAVQPSRCRPGQVIATQALNIGQNTLQFAVGFGVMLYLLFFLLRDGPAHWEDASTAPYRWRSSTNATSAPSSSR
jgi:predicted PurR-regulated permease PerM